MKDGILMSVFKGALVMIVVDLTAKGLVVASKKLIEVANKKKTSLPNIYSNISVREIDKSG